MRVAGSLRRRLLIAALTVMVPLLVGAGLWVILLSNSAGIYKDLAREVSLEEEKSVALLQGMNAAQDSGSRYMEGGSETDLRDFQRSATSIDRALAGERYDEYAERRLLAAAERWWESAKSRVAAYRPGGTGDPEDAFEADLDSATSSVRRLMFESEQEVRDDLAAGERDEQLNWLFGLVALALALVLATLLANRLSKTLVRPLEQLTRAARSLGEGHLDHRVSINSTAELNEVGGTFNAMAAALEEQRAELERQAFADALTGLPNRALFEARARSALDRAAGAAQRVAVLVLNLDGFKLVNDGLGHACGDTLLGQAAGRMRAVVRPSDTLARLGGDQFALLFENVRGLDDALGAGERLRQAFRTPFRLKDSDVLVTASVGIALSAEATQDAAELLRRADLAVHSVKQHGKNATEFFDPDMDDQAADRLATLNALRRAVDRDELVVHYQPIIDLDTGDVRAVEALLRWDRPDVGMVQPVDFIPLAEETGLIVQLGRWVLHAACSEAQAWTTSRLPGGARDGERLGAPAARPRVRGHRGRRAQMDWSRSLRPGARGHRVLGDAELRGRRSRSSTASRPPAYGSRSTTSERATPRSATSGSCRSTSSRSPARSCESSPIPTTTRLSSGASSSSRAASACGWSRRASSTRRSRRSCAPSTARSARASCSPVRCQARTCASCSPLQPAFRSPASAPSWIRTSGLLLRRESLYPS